MGEPQLQLRSRRDRRAPLRKSTCRSSTENGTLLGQKAFTLEPFEQIPAERRGSRARLLVDQCADHGHRSGRHGLRLLLRRRSTGERFPGLLWGSRSAFAATFSAPRTAPPVSTSLNGLTGALDAPGRPCRSLGHAARQHDPDRTRPAAADSRCRSAAPRIPRGRPSRSSDSSSSGVAIVGTNLTGAANGILGLSEHILKRASRRPSPAFAAIPSATSASPEHPAPSRASSASPPRRPPAPRAALGVDGLGIDGVCRPGRGRSRREQHGRRHGGFFDFSASACWPSRRAAPRESAAQTSRAQTTIPA